MPRTDAVIAAVAAHPSQRSQPEIVNFPMTRSFCGHQHHHGHHRRGDHAVDHGAPIERFDGINRCKEDAHAENTGHRQICKWFHLELSRPSEPIRVGADKLANGSIPEIPDRESSGSAYRQPGKRLA